MEKCLNIEGYLSYKTNYFESFSEFIYKQNDKIINMLIFFVVILGVLTLILMN